MDLEQKLLEDGPLLLSGKRWNHCLRTADYAVLMAEQYSADVRTVRIASLAHDLAREKSGDEILEWAKKDQIELSGFCLTHPVLLHGFASAWILQNDYGVTGEPLLNAVRYHTTGHACLDRAGLVVFAADYMEPGRTHLTDDDRDALLRLDLDGLVISILESMDRYLQSRGEESSPDSRELCQLLKKRYNRLP